MADSICRAVFLSHGPRTDIIMQPLQLRILFLHHFLTMNQLSLHYRPPMATPSSISRPISPLLTSLARTFLNRAVPIISLLMGQIFRLPFGILSTGLSYLF